MRAKNTDKEKFWNALYGCLIDNLCISLYVLHENFGFGEERLERFVDATVKAAKQFEEWADDEALDIKTDDYRKKYREKHRELLCAATKNFLPDDFREMFFETRTPTDSEIVRRVKADERKKTVSVKEAAEMQVRMQAFGNFLKDRSD